jgi:hypothetical protein
MNGPAHHVLLQASARLNADGHTELASDVLQLARQWTPESERQLVGHPNVLPLQQDTLPDA